MDPELRAARARTDALIAGELRTTNRTLKMILLSPVAILIAVISIVALFAAWAVVAPHQTQAELYQASGITNGSTVIITYDAPAQRSGYISMPDDTNNIILGYVFTNLDDSSWPYANGDGYSHEPIKIRIASIEFANGHLVSVIFDLTSATDMDGNPIELSPKELLK